MTRRTAIRICLALLVSAPAASVIAAEGAWLTLAPMPDPRQEVGVAELNGKIYVVGGLPSTTRVQEYDPATDTWRFRASLPVAVDHPAAASESVCQGSDNVTSTPPADPLAMVNDWAGP